MKITEFGGFFGTSYQILIGKDDNLNELEITECFKSQYPKEKAVVGFSRITAIEVGLIIIGLKLK